MPPYRYCQGRGELREKRARTADEGGLKGRGELREGARRLAVEKRTQHPTPRRG
ncbi:hypothetical protein GCM10010326_23880 [Streptomyces xanthochromogenes]|uniref:Uncharacterized protein n=1 Tax=Streptomyces xanthochromogenes TaxID=67384 RepID=A0ABQ3A1G1_9ACTN|nr:hypothetical protein GCM10010326_23880 [Streptomyces xanthochromogenes]